MYKKNQNRQITELIKLDGANHGFRKGDADEAATRSVDFVRNILQTE